MAYEKSFLRTEMMLGEEAMIRLRAAHVAVFGLGGVGGYAAEALVRAGVGTLTLVDHDVFSESNLNRQIGALYSTLGQKKAEVMAKRAIDIQPNCRVFPICACYSEKTRDLFFPNSFDLILDAIDLVTCKLDLIETAVRADIPILSALGTGNKRDPFRFRMANISDTFGCPLARVVRRELRRRGIEKHRVLFSPEEPVKSAQPEVPAPGRRSTPGSVSFVPSCAGLMLAGEAILSIADGKLHACPANAPNAGTQEKFFADI